MRASQDGMTLLPGQPLVSHGPDDTRRLAERLIEAMPGPRVCLALHGELGSGKTCFVQGLADALEISRPITSPTFTLINEYRGLRSLIHMDLFRLNTPDDILALGFDEYLEEDGVIAIEWAERACEILPTHTVHISFEAAAGAENERRITVQPPEPPPDGGTG